MTGHDAVGYAIAFLAVTFGCMCIVITSVYGLFAFAAWKEIKEEQRNRGAGDES